MTTPRRPCPLAPGPLEDYAARFDPLLASLAQRRGLRDYLQGLLMPRDRNKTLTGLAGTEPVVGAQHREVQRLQWFLSESAWNHEAVNQQRIALLCEDPATAPHARGVLVIDDTGDRKDGRHTAHVARQYLGSVGKTDNGIVAVTSLWADPRCYWPLHAVPYTPASRLPKGKSDPGFRTKPKLAAELVEAAQQAGIPFRAVVADCFYGDNDGFVAALGRVGVAFVLALKPRKGTWAPEDEPHTPVEAARELDWGGPRRPGPWRRVTRRFRDGHAETWWAADARLAGWGPEGPHRLVVATTDPATLPKLTTWYLLTNLPRPAARRVQRAQLAEIVATYGLRNWVEQGYKQVKDELGWADFQVRSDRAIRRHWTLVCLAFSFCWHAGQAGVAPAAGAPAPPQARSVPATAGGAARGVWEGLEPDVPVPARGGGGVVAQGAAAGARLAGPVGVAAALLARMVNQPTAPAAPAAA
ncbi:MAG TPA: IS701 family transposase [Actinomycetes bacterium]|jgi:SRSO17 transposase|nr:IS701 family transposase [Actinomycetes bacterium]